MPPVDRKLDHRNIDGAHEGENSDKLCRTQLIINEWCIEMGGHTRTGLEDNVRYDKDRLAKSNAELVERVARMVKDAGRKVATPAEARALLKLAA